MVGGADQSRTTELVHVCGVCRQAFAAQAWIVVGPERNDLLERAATGTLHRVRCPHCQAEAEVDEPCLIRRDPGAAPRTIFVPSALTSPADDVRAAAELAVSLDGEGPMPVTWAPRHVGGGGF